MKCVKSKILSKLMFAVVAILLIFSFVNFFGIKREFDKETYAENINFSTEFLKELESSSDITDTSFMISNNFVVDGEDQLLSDFCWLFSSLKCLETSYMIQRNEWYNFSETAMSYLNYLNNLKNGQNIYDITGNILAFDNIANKYGLVFENDVSNDLLSKFNVDNYQSINANNYKDYEYISDFADTSLMNNAKLVSFGINTYFDGLSYVTKINMMKKFIKNYGALYLAIGYGDAILYEDSMNSNYSIYSYTSKGHEDSLNISAISGHSVCIIGWNASGFIALNSWGNADGRHQLFCIPFREAENDLNELMKTVKGYLIEDNASVNFENNNSTSLKNVFNVGEKIELKLNLSKAYDINNARVEIFKGTENVTFNFKINYDIEKSFLKISENFKKSSKKAGGYVVRIYINNDMIASRSFLVLSGSEVWNVSLEKNISYNNYKTEFLCFNNEYLSSTASTTLILNPKNQYRLRLELSKFSECLFAINDPLYNRFKDSDGKDALFQISKIKVKRIKNNSVEWVETDLLINKIISYDTNDFIFELPNFSTNSSYQRSILSFDILINPTISGGEQTKLTFMCFIGYQDGMDISESYSIHYELDGGKNSNLNINSFPKYEKYSQMTDFELNNPTKSGYEFMGWFSDKLYNNQVLSISDQFKSDMVLYAKWDIIDIGEFVNASIGVDSVISFDHIQKNINSDTIIYGDSICFKYNFVPLSKLDLYSYQARLIAYYVVDGQKVYIDSLNNKSIQSEFYQLFSIDFPELKQGDYEVFVVANIVINNVLTLSNVSDINFSVDKKSIELESEDLCFEYDKAYHYPIMVPTAGSVYDIDLENFNLSFSISPKLEVGVYKFNVILENDNYKLDTNLTYQFEIKPRKLEISWGKNKVIYNGQPQSPTFELTGVLDGDSVSIKLKESYENVGKYVAEIKVDSISNKNYYIESSSFDFEIIPVEIELKFNDITERLLVSPKFRKEVTYELSGEIFYNITEEKKQSIIDSLNLIINCEGLVALEFGKYEITATYNNDNFNIKFINGIYNLIGPYKAFYKLPDGRIYEEYIEEGQNPKGITRDIYNYSIFQKLEYSKPLEGDGTENLYITVTVKDYTFYIIIGIVITLFIATYLILTRKQRRNKVS